MFAQSTLNRGFLVAAATASVCCGSLVMAAPSYAAGFEGDFDPSNWTLSNSPNASGFLDESNAPDFIEFASRSSPLTTPNTFSTYLITGVADGTFNFDWNFQPRQTGTSQLEFQLNDVLTPLATILSESTLPFSANVVAGDVFGFRITTLTSGGTGGLRSRAEIFNLDFVPAPDPVIPTPAMLPGLVGMWIAAMRKKRQQEVAKEES